MRALFPFILLLSVTPLPGLAGQDPSGGQVVGRIVDGDTGSPLGYARITLTPLPGGVLLSPRDGPARLTGARTVQTGSDGRYRFAALAGGKYRLHVQRIGYRANTLDIDLDGGQGLTLSVGLTVAPIRLQPLENMSPPRDVYRMERPRDSSMWDRTALEQWRQQHFLESDVHVLASLDLSEAVTLGQMDVLRALQRLPGVSARDDWLAQPWVRGAGEGHARLYFDGMPIFNPVHAGGMLTAINPDALGGVFLYSGARPPQFSDGSAAVMDLRSRSARPGKNPGGALTLSNAAAGVMLEQRWKANTMGAIVAARRSWLKSTRRLVNTSGGVGAEIPNDFADGVFRFDALLRPDVSLEVSGTWQRDWIRGFLEGGTANNRSSWGTTAARATLQFPMANGTARQSIGVSRFSSTIRQIEPRTPLAAFDSLPTQEPTDNRLMYISASGVWSQPRGDDTGAEWKFGYDASTQMLHYRGAPPTPHSVLTYLYTADIRDDVTNLSAWGERWWRPDDKLTMRVGARVTFNTEIDESRVSPHVSLRYQVDDELSFSAAMGYHHQWVQPLAQSGIGFGPGLGISPVWVASADGRILETELRTMGMERWVGSAWLFSANYYSRETSGLIMPDPRPGTTDDDAFLVTGHNNARGLELQLRRLTGPWTGSVAYALAESKHSAEGLTFPAPSDRRHVFSGTAGGELPTYVAGGVVRVGAAADFSSGAPYTRIHPGWYDCSAYVPGDHCQPIVPTMVEAPNGERSPWSIGLNLLLDWSRAFSHWRVTSILEIQNVLNTPRSVTYAVAPSCRRRYETAPTCTRADDRFIPGLGRHYELGLRVSF